MTPLGSKKAVPLEEAAGEASSPAEDSLTPERTAPERIGRYDLCFELASGGMASVYLARIHGASGFEKLVALKRIHRHLAKEPGYVDMFLDEARIASRITHPNVCSVFDFGESDGEYYIAMEYLVGEPLSRLCARVATDKQQCSSQLFSLKMARIIADACEGLHAAHELKDANGDFLHVVHRDVSPRNLFVTYDGAAQVVDFGIASARQRMHHTATGKLKGTFAYMAPEQLTADPIDRRVDIWALGVTLWEMLAVKRLFKGDTTANTVFSVMYDQVQPPSSRRSQVPKELDQIVLKALQRDPANRWQTAREMGRALRRFLGSQEHVIGPAELSEWMKELFPQGEARKSQLMEIARMTNVSVPALPQPGETFPNHTATDITIAEDKLRRWKRWLTSRVGIGLAMLGALVIPAIVALGIGETEAGAGTKAPAEIATSAPPIEVAEPGKAVRPPANELALQADEKQVTEPAIAAPPSNHRARSKQRPKPQPGTINLVTRGGWAEVYKGKRSLGSTPRRLTLPSGRHRLVLKPFGDGKPKVIYVTVEARKTKKVSVPLD